jgi:hypothetical protein
MKLHELVKMDERFIRWLNNRDARQGIDRALADDARYLCIFKTHNNECYAYPAQTLEQLEKQMVPSDGSGWEPVALFDLEAAAELRFHIKQQAVFGDLVKKE